MRYLLLNLLCLLCLLAPAVRAQEAEKMPDDDGVLFETLMSEQTAGSMLILDNTRTKLGRDFYEAFYQKWAAVNTTLPRDTVAEAANGKPTEALEDQFTVMIDELPAQGLSSIVSIRINDLLVWQEFIQPRIGFAEVQAEGAVGVVLDYLLNYQAIQAQLGSEDQQGTGIY
jgi:hypothetical protein